ncbi:inactive protein RESTRICTED TEV MOVEMENT 2-like [Tripterygium wilfordii]|uniref:inactive protein RESTRICTED TEV MOVEMENT 2-like n=1 Tax=Tripterygium wilfordii TaxID=458696 RepID=UPI0018F8484F|nr:inactive protein RESTRICTED TEV MOVEMENT 2-like [Tripterygium wilfordii]
MAMSMRQRRGGNIIYRPHRRIAPPSYETFQPNSEWIEEDSSTILLVYVEGFLKDQIKVDHDESAGLIRVSGERPVLDRRHLRFNQQFSAPEDCNPEKWKPNLMKGFSGSQFQSSTLVLKRMPRKPSFKKP